MNTSSCACESPTTITYELLSIIDALSRDSHAKPQVDVGVGSHDHDRPAPPSKPSVASAHNTWWRTMTQDDIEESDEARGAGQRRRTQKLGTS